VTAIFLPISFRSATDAEVSISERIDQYRLIWHLRNQSLFISDILSFLIEVKRKAALFMDQNAISHVKMALEEKWQSRSISSKEPCHGSSRAQPAASLSWTKSYLS
jgi:hypothetical protein